MQHDGRLDPAYGFERDPGVGHATCRKRHISWMPGAIFTRANILPTASIRLKVNCRLTSNFG